MEDFQVILYHLRKIPWKEYLSHFDSKKSFELNLLGTEGSEMNVRNWSNLAVAMQLK